MFSPFSPADSVRLYRLQRRGVSLDLKRGLTQPPHPLWEAWLAYLTQQAMGQPTWVLYDPHDGEAFIQIRYRPHQAAADCAYLAPSLTEHRRVASAWSMLLDAACIDAAGRSIQRVFANVPEAGAEVDVFHQSGFTFYTTEEIYRLARPPAAQHEEQQWAPRQQRPEDWPALQKLCVAVTPQRVRQAEGGISLSVDEGRNFQRYVLEGARGGELIAALGLCTGDRAYWLQALVHPDAREIADGLIQWGLASIRAQVPKPIYCVVRNYESGVRGALDAAGFELYATRALMVKQTVAWVKTAVQEVIPALKGNIEAVPPAFHINGEPDLRTVDGRLAAKREP